MISKKEPVILAGILVGMGCTVECTVNAIKASQLGTDEHTYTHFRIQKVSPNLQNGQYQLSCAGRTIPVQRQVGGLWVSVGP
jgi:hypothetical protein